MEEQDLKRKLKAWCWILGIIGIAILAVIIFVHLLYWIVWIGALVVVCIACALMVLIWRINRKVTKDIDELRERDSGKS